MTTIVYYGAIARPIHSVSCQVTHSQELLTKFFDNGGDGLVYGVLINQTLRNTFIHVVLYCGNKVVLYTAY